MMQLETTNKIDILTFLSVFQKSEYINLQPYKIVNFQGKIKTFFYKYEIIKKWYLSFVAIASNKRSFHLIFFIQHFQKMLQMALD